MLVSVEPAMFVPVEGHWGLRGATSVTPGQQADAPDDAQRAHHGLAERDGGQGEETKTLP